MEYEKAVEWKLKVIDYNPTDTMCTIKSVTAPKGASPLAQFYISIYGTLSKILRNIYDFTYFFHVPC